MSGKPSKRFTSITVNAMEKQGNWPDGDGLYLRVRPDKSKSWAFRFKRAGKTHWLSLGPVRDVPLAEAREQARQMRNQLRNGFNPLEARRERQALALNEAGRTFDAVADLYITEHSPGWRNAKHGAQWKSTLNTYASPVIGKMAVGSIGLDEILRILRPIWKVKPETASRLRGRIEAVLDYGGVHGWRKGDNPARWSGHLDQVLPAKEKVRAVVHHAAVKVADLPGVVEKLASNTSTSALCLRFLIHTAARSGEARGARWNEIDLNHTITVKRAGKETIESCPIWTIPGSRMKAAQEHRVPLSEAAVAVLQAIEPLRKRPDSLVFPGGKAGSPLSDVAVNKALASVASAVTVHGMRSTFRDWCADQTAYPREVAEAALAHTNRDKTELAYRRGDALEQRARMMRDWSAYCTQQPARTDNVTPIRAAV